MGTTRASELERPQCNYPCAGAVSTRRPTRTARRWITIRPAATSTRIRAWSGCRNLRGEVCFGAIQASVTALSITCRWTLLHSGQVNVRKSNVLGSIAVNLVGEPQAVHCGPWFCVSSMVGFPQFGARSSPASHPTEVDFIGSLATTSICTKWHLRHSNRRCSKPIAPGLMRASIIRDVQREQGGRSMRVSDWPEGK
jgi:hypothetical protein